MVSSRIVPMTAIVIYLGMFVAAPASAQSSTGPTFQNVTSQHHQRIHQLMKDMTQEMTRMMEQMSQGALTPEQQKQMSQRMALMSTMMHRMSILEANPAMKDAEWQKQMDQMRKQMDEMMRDSKMGPGAR